MQVVTLVIDVPTPLYNYVQPVTEQKMHNQTTLGKLIPKIYIKWRKILGSELARRRNPTNMKSINQ